MKSLLLWLLLAGIVSVSLGAVYSGSYKDPEHPGKCVIKEHNLILSSGETAKQPGACVRITCGNDSVAEFASCGVIAPPPGCKLGEPVDPEGEYPKCCERKFIC